MKRSVSHDRQLEVDTFPDTKPVQSGERIGDVVVTPKTGRQTSGRVEDGLEQALSISRQPDHDEVPVVKSHVDERDHQ